MDSGNLGNLSQVPSCFVSNYFTFQKDIAYKQ